MNQDKARELFSAYFEGTLEPGLRQAFEQRLRADANLQADYAAFAATMEDLNRLSDEEIEVPMFLSDRIATRVEQERNRRESRVPVFALWLRGLAFTGLAAAAIYGAVVSLHSGGSVDQANLVGSTSATIETPRFVANGGDVTFQFRPSKGKSVTVSSAVTGRELERFTADAGSPVRPLKNPNAEPALLKIQVEGEPGATILALPGTATSSVSTGDGAVRDFAAAVAARYRTPVLLRVADPDKKVIWKLDGVDAVKATATALNGQGYGVDERTSGLITIQDR